MSYKNTVDFVNIEADTKEGDAVLNG